jgi:large subunit ribosomal protein L30
MFPWKKFLKDNSLKQSSLLNVMPKVRITKIRSEIDHTGRHKKTLQALGLRKLHSSKVVELNPALEGQIAKVKHLLKVESIS